MNRILLPTALLLLAAMLPAQEPKDATSERGLAEAKTAYDALVADYAAATAANGDAMRAVTKTPEYQKAAKDRDRDAMNELWKQVTPVDRAGFVARFQAGAEQHAGEGAIDFLTWVAINGRDKEATLAAVDTLVTDYGTSPRLLTLVESSRSLMRPMGDASWRKMCERIAEESPHAIVRAWAIYWPAYTTMSGRKSSDEAKAEAQQRLGEAEKLAEGTGLAARIAAPRFQEQRLQIGMEVPDIAGEDLDGVSFKLSDYRGKVVVIDFWGDW